MGEFRGYGVQFMISFVLSVIGLKLFLFGVIYIRVGNESGPLVFVL